MKIRKEEVKVKTVRKKKKRERNTKKKKKNDSINNTKKTKKNPRRHNKKKKKRKIWKQEKENLTWMQIECASPVTASPRIHLSIHPLILPLPSPHSSPSFPYLNLPFISLPFLCPSLLYYFPLSPTFLSLPSPYTILFSPRSPFLPLTYFFTSLPITSPLFISLPLIFNHFLSLHLSFLLIPHRFPFLPFIFFLHFLALPITSSLLSSSPFTFPFLSLPPHSPLPSSHSS